MTDTNETPRRAPLSLKKTETSTVKQSFSHGRTKAVVVEKKRTARVGGDIAPAKPAAKAAEVKPDTAAPAVQAPVAREASPRPGVVLRQLTEEEKARRGAALADARVYEEEARKRADEEARHRAIEEER